MSHRIARLALCAAIAVTVPFLTACNSSSSGANGSAADTNPYHLMTPGMITAATQSAQPPFVVADANGGNPKGFSIDLAEEVAKRLGLRVEYRVTDLQGLLAGLPGNRYDMGIAGIGATEERKKNIDFVKPYYWGFVGILTKKDSPAKSLNDFNGKKVGVVSGSVQETFANNNVTGAQITKFKDQSSAIGQLLTGGIDGFVVGGADAEEYIVKEPTLKIAAEADTTQGTSFPVKKGNKALVDAFDTKIDEMIADGTYMKLYNKWFKRPPSAKIIEFRPGLAKVLPAPSSTT
jgi:polar amino acid transport system substrate-binding protein